MDNNYPLDRSGEIDPDIQQLEETLGALRYQPQAAADSDLSSSRRSRSFYPLLAIAAAIALVAIALGLWFAFKQHQVTTPLDVRQNAQPAPKQIQKELPQPKREPEQSGS